MTTPDKPIYHAIDVDLVMFDPQPIWLPFFDTPDSPAIHLAPLDWTQYEFARRICCEPGTDVCNPRTFLRQLLTLSQADDWRGVVRHGQPLPFTLDACWRILCANVELGTRFSLRLQTIALNIQTNVEAARKNSGAGDGTPSTAPATATSDGRSASNV